jgi:hypothetical protein
MCKTRWMGDIGRRHDRLALLLDDRRFAIVDTGGCQQVQPGMIVLQVILAEERVRSLTRCLDAREAIRIIRVVLHRLELGLGKRIIVRDVRSTVAFGHAQIEQ